MDAGYHWYGRIYTVKIQRTKYAVICPEFRDAKGGREPVVIIPDFHIPGKPYLPVPLTLTAINPCLPQNKVNKVNNLASVHKECLDAINNHNADITNFDAKARKKIEDFRKRLVQSHAKTTV